MLCMRCRKHATLDRTVFKGTAPTTVRLCDECVAQTGAEAHLERIKDAGDHAAKEQAVEAFLEAVKP